MPTTFKNWSAYFLQNKKHFAHITFSGSPELSHAEKELITGSIQQFQRGESSAGLHLVKGARETGDTEYYESIQLFLQEEHRHASSLARYMKQEAIPLIESHWVDSAFRKLRRKFEFQNTITVLLTAEIVAAVYYKALMEATGSKTLKAICGQILCDEEMHINFQAFTIRSFQKQNSGLKQFLYRLYHRVLMTGTALVLWPFHRKVLGTGGLPFFRYLYAIEKEFTRTADMIEGKAPIAVRGVNRESMLVIH
jgi:hypothetical protein